MLYFFLYSTAALVLWVVCWLEEKTEIGAIWKKPGQSDKERSVTLPPEV